MPPATAPRGRRRSGSARACGPGDTVARFGGDEFGILLDGIRGLDEAHPIADRILESSGRRSSSAVASGSSAPAWASRSATPAGPSPGDILREAEIALVQAKRDAGHALHVLRAGDERRDAGAGRARDRPAAGPRARRAAAPLPADRRPRVRPDRRLRGARPLAAPDPRPRPAAVVHPARRGDRADRPARALGPGDGLPPGPRRGGHAARIAARDERQPVGPPVRPARPRRRRSARSSRRPGCRRGSSSSRSPRAS